MLRHIRLWVVLGTLVALLGVHAAAQSTPEGQLRRSARHPEGPGAAAGAVYAASHVVCGFPGAMGPEIPLA